VNNLGDNSLYEKSRRSIQDLGIRREEIKPWQYRRAEEELTYDEEEDEVEAPWWLWRWQPRWRRRRRSDAEGCGGGGASPTGSCRGSVWTGLTGGGGAAAPSRVEERRWSGGAGKRSRCCRWRGGGALASRRSGAGGDDAPGRKRWGRASPGGTARVRSPTPLGVGFCRQTFFFLK